MKNRYHYNSRYSARKAFTLIELLVVIAIIAILSAILFPAFSAVKEQGRQSDTMSSLHAMYEGARMYKEDNGQFPSALFGYAEVPSPNAGIPGNAPAMPALLSDTANPSNGVYTVTTPMTSATEDFSSVTAGILPYLYPHQDKNIADYLCTDSTVTNPYQVTPAYYPLSLTGGTPVMVTWVASSPTTPCATFGDVDLPVRQLSGNTTNPTAYVGQPKLFYAQDAMDIGPMLNSSGKQITDSKGNPMYELHYATDWTHMRYNQVDACDEFAENGAPPALNSALNGTPITEQLKYQNPPADNTVLTWVTNHVSVAGSNNVIILLLDGTARKISYTQASQELPLNYH